MAASVARARGGSCRGPAAAQATAGAVARKTRRFTLGQPFGGELQDARVLRDEAEERLPPGGIRDQGGAGEEAGAGGGERRLGVGLAALGLERLGAEEHEA